MGSFGFGTTDSETTTNVHNENVAAQSGIALGNQSYGNSVSVTTADPEVAKTAIIGNVAVAGSALNFGDHALDISSDISRSSISAIQSNAALSILSSNDMATKFAKATSVSEANNIALLSSLSTENANSSIRSSQLASQALDSSFAIAHNAAPQTDAAQLENVTGSVSKILYVFFGLGALVAVVFFFRKK